jgi:two-component system nitrogen regulation response regulator GlnG
VRCRPFREGAFEYLPKPFDLPKAVELIRRAVEESQREEVAEERMAATPEMLGQAPAMQDVFRAIGRLSQSNVTVMITGESGSGKELVARALHKHSPRANGPFVAINTAAIPKDLLESELFGHERGAFTGAQTMRRGRFEQADGGTLFLDEIGDMPFDLQTRLLRVLSDGHFYRVGGHSAVKTNVRVIAATHQNLEQRVKEGVFREDLFHRLNVIRLRLPALRERREDIYMLARHFLVQSAQQLGVEPKRISDAALHRLSGFEFPGNVRQLENVCHWLTVMAPAQVIDEKDLPPEVLALPAASPGAVLEGTGHGAVPDVSSHPVPGTVGAVVQDAGADSQYMDAATIPGNQLGTPVVQMGSTAFHHPVDSTTPEWMDGLKAEAQGLLDAGRDDIWDVLTRKFESQLILTALANTRGRRIEAAQRLGIGRNTITRKIQELNPPGVKGALSQQHPVTAPRVHGRWGARSCGVACRPRTSGPAAPNRR